MAIKFGRGYEEVKVERKRQEVARENSGMKLWDFFIKDDGGEAEVRFLTDEPINFSEHTEKVYVNGQERYEKVICTESADCPMCASGNKATFKGAYLIVDRRSYKYKKDGKDVTGKDQVRLYVQGTRVLSQLDRITTKYGKLSKRDVNIVRLGKGTDTTYTIEREDESVITEKEIESFLPENLRKLYDGSMESLYKIVEEQLMMRLPEGEVETDDSEDSSEEVINENIVSLDDEEETPVKRITLGGLKKKPVENSIKSILKKK